MKTNLEHIIQTLKIGEPVEIKEKGTDTPVSGDLRKIVIRKNKPYLLIYNYFHRKEILYRLNGREELVRQKKKPFLGIKGIQLSHSDGSDTKLTKTLKIMLYPITLLLLIVLIMTMIPDIPNNFKKGTTYESFLAKDMNFYELFRAITRQLSYRYDLTENWMTPVSAWDQKTADCEEFAAICSDYLNRRGIENYLVGISFSDRQGHAVVFARDPKENVFYMIDLTRALEKWGVRKLNAVTLDEAVQAYTDRDAYLFKIPSMNGEKILLSVIEGKDQ